jgi:type IV pilus assembly protein PilB
VYGASVVIHIPDPHISLRRLNDIDFREQDRRRLAELLDRRRGLVLVTGPANSGKTTTLYATLRELNTGEVHIVTVEDPVEYRLEGVVQTQVQPAAGFGFPQALRSILRHDPDVMLIGESDDPATARIAVDSALAGHLVLSTLHTDSAARTVTRLVEIGIPPYLVNATLAGVVSQRLLRRNCEHCLVVENVGDMNRHTLGVNDSEVFYRGSGCTECGGTGHRGRVAVRELLEMTPQLRELVATGANCERLEALAVEQGMVRLALQALTLARSGTISLGEVFRTGLAD